MSEQVRRWQLGKDFEAQVLIDPARLTPRSLARMRRYIDALEMEASISWPTEGAPAPGPGIAASAPHVNADLATVGPLMTQAEAEQLRAERAAEDGDASDPDHFIT